MPSARTSCPHPALAGFHAPVQAWFAASFAAPTRVQELAWPAIQAEQSALILAPTGSGKTLAAFLAAIDRLMFAPVPEKGQRCRVLYISPLKALAVDVERNLRAPLIGVTRYAERLGVEAHLPEVAIRSGDTPARERAQFLRHPADILITTPESLYLLLTSGAREALRSVRSVILDEVHALVGTKRGAHLSLSLERLEELTGSPLQRLGLSATVRPIEEAARFLGGFTLAEPVRSASPESVMHAEPGAPDHFPVNALAFLDEADSPGADGRPGGVPRPVTIVDAGKRKQLDLTVEVPVEDMAKLGQVIEIPSGPAAQPEARTSIWPAIHPLILKLIRSHRSTLIFVNSRRLAERLAGALNELAGEEIVRAHHGSIAREQRLQIEDDLKAGKLPGMVATSSLELGIDMGAIDLVIQVEAPPSVASGIQRIGRAGHQLGVPSEGVIIPKFRGDLLACAALTDRMRSGQVESLRYPRNPLDVLAQQIVAMVAVSDWEVDALERLVRRAAPFTELTRGLLESVLDMLSGRYPSDEFAELRPRVTWDRLAGTLRAREGARRVAVTNGGTIPDRGSYGVFLVGSEQEGGRSMRVGELDEEMVFETHVGDAFVLGASTWRVEEITHDRVLVSPAPGQPGKMPFWHGDGPGRPLEFGRAIGALTRTLRSLDTRPPNVAGSGPEAALSLLREKHALTEGAARNLLQYLRDQAEATGIVPDDRTIVVERYLDEMGDWRVCLLSPFGSRVHAPWALAIAGMLREQTDIEPDILWTDDGIVVRLPEADEPPSPDMLIPDPDEVEDLVIRQLGAGGSARSSSQGSPVSAIFAARFREAAARALLLPRRHPGRRAPLWQQRKRAADLFHATSRYGTFPIILETYRECLRDVFDIPALIELLRDIRRRALRVVPVTTRVPSPFAASLLFNYVANFIYEGDAPLAERRAQALLLDQAQLRELLGEVELRELLDPQALEELEWELQHLVESRKARHADGLHDLLLRLGDLSAPEIAARCRVEPAPSAGADAADSDTPAFGAEEWVRQLVRQRRIVALTIAGEVRYVAAEDAGRYRDALGIPPPLGLPAAFLEFVRDPLGDLVARYARTHGPFTVEELGRRLGLGPATLQPILSGLEVAGRVAQGEFRPDGVGREWCDQAVLRTLRQRSLARLRREVEPVEQAALGRLYLAWQNVAAPRRGRDALLGAIEQLQGAALPASDLESRILPARVEDYRPHELDELTASGAVLWTGVEPLGEHDGRIALFLTEHAPLLLPSTPSGTGVAGSGGERERCRGPLHDCIREHLARLGACFFPQLLQACGSAPSYEVQETLWDLVWAGEVTNDTLQPLRAYLMRRPLGRHGGSGARAQRSRLALPGEVRGRWSLVTSFLYRQATSTERLTALARQLLDRYGVLTREAVLSEGVPGGFSAVYGVLKALEESGQVRRGYFVSGLGATQFAVPGAVDRLRSLRHVEEDEPTTVLLAANDPANPYGAAVAWPRHPGAAVTKGPTAAPEAFGVRRLAAANGNVAMTKGPTAAPETFGVRRLAAADGNVAMTKGPTAAPEGADTAPLTGTEPEAARRAARAAGAIVILVDGALAAWMGRRERSVTTFFDQVPDRDPEEVALCVARALAAEVSPTRRRAIFVQQVDGAPARDTPLAAALTAAGFTYGPHGYMKRL